MLEGLKVVEVKNPELLPEFNRPSEPVVGVNWYESVVHALLRGSLLATEAQWEYAATCGGRFKHGTSSGELRSDEAHYYPHSEGITADIGSYPANVWGLNDMTGNVWEWVMDWVKGYSSGRQTDPTGPAEGKFRGLRGGSWDDKGSGRSARRLPRQRRPRGTQRGSWVSFSCAPGLLKMP